MQSFEFQFPTRVRFGAGRLAELGELVAGLGGRRVLVVTDPGVAAAGHVGRAIESLAAAGVEATVFDRVHENPTTTVVEEGLAAAAEYRPDMLVAVGGGSSMDSAKGINFLYTGGGRMQDYWGVGKATAPMLPSVAVPTTAGTGSETQSFALITDAATHVKMACGDKKAAFRAALLDPELTLSQPRGVTTVTGVDALAHAVETFVTTKRNPISLAFSREAWRLLSTWLPRVLDDESNLEARGGVQLGACLAGLAIENSMLGAAHALANPLTAEFGVVHGRAVGLMLPHVIRFNSEVVGDQYAELATVTMNGSGSAGALADRVGELTAAAGLPHRLSDVGVTGDRIDALAENAAKQWTANFNPRPVDVAALRGLYESAL